MLHPDIDDDILISYITSYQDAFEASAMSDIIGVINQNKILNHKRSIVLLLKVQNIRPIVYWVINHKGEFNTQLNHFLCANSLKYQVL